MPYVKNQNFRRHQRRRRQRRRRVFFQNFEKILKKFFRA
jgi:hypothetical protein